MKSTTFILATLSSMTLTLADSTTNPFTAAGTDDLRGPCPMLNSLANHGFLPHSGAEITADDIATAFDVALNINATGLSTFTNAALAASTTGNSSTFNLNDLNAHGILEHDGSLSRADIFFGDNHSFNASVWAGTKEILSTGGDSISITVAGTARSSRFALDKTQNPTFNMTATNIQISALESALYLTTFGDPVNGNAVNEFVNVFFEQERLPFTEGWTRPTTQATITTLQTMANLIAAVTV